MDLVETVRALAAEGNIAALCDTVQEAEFDPAATADAESAATLYSVLLVTHLIEDDLNSARFAWKRIPQDVKQASPELVALWQVGQAMWQRQPVAEALGAFAWSPLVQTLVAELQESIKQRAFTLIGRAYTTVSPETLAAYSGMTPAAAKSEALSQYNWTFDEERGTLVTAPSADTPTKAQTILLKDHLAQLCSIVQQLE